MSKSFFDNFKSMRKQRGLTQEQIAETLGVSCQAVSKWETNSSYPDISLLPIIADYFGVSVDYLIGHDTSKQVEEINTVCVQVGELFDQGRAWEAISILREMLIKHPGNEKLMYNLAWALSGTCKDSKENYQEAILLYHKILEISTDTEMRTKVSRDLIYRYYTLGDIEKAKYFANTLPSFDLCREYNVGRGNILDGRELSDYLRANIQLYGKAMLECFAYFENVKILTEDEKKPYSMEIAKAKMALLKEVLK
jgi:transcriptional regulator with XRE-family HTH domain